MHTRLADCVCAQGPVDCSGSCSSRELRGPPPSTSLPSTGAGSHTGPAQELQVLRGRQRASGVLEGSSHLWFGLGPTQKQLLDPRPGPLLGPNARALRLPGDRRWVMGHAPRRAGQPVSQRGSHLPREPHPRGHAQAAARDPGAGGRGGIAAKATVPPLADRDPRTSRLHRSGHACAAGCLSHAGITLLTQNPLSAHCPTF